MSFDPSEPSGRWSFRDDAMPLRHVVRRLRRVGPQHVGIEGLGDVVVLSAEDVLRLSGKATGRALVEAVAASPHLDIVADRAPMPVRDVAS